LKERGDMRIFRLFDKFKKKNERWGDDFSNIYYPSHLLSLSINQIKRNSII